MRLIGNLIWLIFGGLSSWLSWTIAGLLWCLTIVGIPIGMQCFKIASFGFAPFGKHLENQGGSVSFLVNVIWFVLFGWELAITHLVSAFCLAITIVGIPFAVQQLKMVGICLAPFGKIVVRD
ncbi:hypothetical protein Hs30E_02280 [Lactococcus hodotermopsidis]|uniref:Inner membrane component domain-containing protein n=1 Tax=Pseudolactococcus hodotermopsidis TaxID=2709157 RepID=A0A6A0BCX4_9LACT|nr:YccF domain-containing protein [Lactococcus hodotermopsidis]GFH41677.1 hypothetical protein Hs30E_02280 [Lactococcus hodotermopsidis]